MIEQWERSDSKRRNELLKSVYSFKKRAKSQLSITAEKTHKKVFQKIDCLDCANCCSSIPPIVIKSDIKRISKFLKVSESEFEKQHIRIDEDGDKVMNASPCTFLDSDNACKIYEVRPKACRAYPHTGDDEFIDNLHLHKQNVQYCPAVFHILERLSHYK